MDASRRSGPPPPGPFRAEFWRSPLRGPWLASALGFALLPLIVICAITGFLSHVAYYPWLDGNSVTGTGGIHLGFDLYLFDWPSSPPWLYALNQGLHVTSGLMAIPLLLGKLWSAMPKLFEWPPVRSIAHSLERLSLAFLVGGSLFVFFTGVMNIQVYYPWGFSFVPAHYYASFIFLAALGLHLTLKLPVVRRAFHEQGIVRPLRQDLAHTRPELPREGTTAPAAPAQPTMSRRGLLATLGAGSVGLGLMGAAQQIGGPLRTLGLFAPHGRSLGTGPNGFQVNKTAAAVGVRRAETGPDWRLRVRGASSIQLTREELLAMDQHTYSLPIACVEGWSTTQSWTGVRLRDLIARAGSHQPAAVLVESLQPGGAFSKAALASEQVADPRSLLALRVNGADLSLDHGYPARVILPAAPGVHCTKWVSGISTIDT